MDKLTINDPPPPPEKKPSMRKDTLRNIEVDIQDKWEQAKVRPRNSGGRGREV
jgi:hypothetical protein